MYCFQIVNIHFHLLSQNFLLVFKAQWYFARVDIHTLKNELLNTHELINIVKIVLIYIFFLRI